MTSRRRPRPACPPLVVLTAVAGLFGGSVTVVGHVLAWYPIVAANLALLETDAADGEAMNVGSTDTITITDLAAAVVDATVADVEPVHEEAKAGDAGHTHADDSKVAELIGYEPTVTTREGVEQFVNLYRANEEWYRPLAAD